MRNRLLPCQCKGAACPVHQAHAAPWAPDPHARGSAPGRARARPRPQPAAPRRGAPPPRLPQTPWARAPGAHMQRWPPSRHEWCVLWSLSPRSKEVEHAHAGRLFSTGAAAQLCSLTRTPISCGAARAYSRNRDRSGVGLMEVCFRYERARGAPLLRVLLQAHERVAEPQDLAALGLDQRQHLGPAMGAHIACSSGPLTAAAPCGHDAPRAPDDQSLAWCPLQCHALSGGTQEACGVRLGAVRLRGCKQGVLAHARLARSTPSHTQNHACPFAQARQRGSAHPGGPGRHRGARGAGGARLAASAASAAARCCARRSASSASSMAWRAMMSDTS